MSFEATSAFSEELRLHGFHSTPNRISILETVSQNPHSTADEILQATRKTVKSISRQTVFDALNAFVEKGLIRRIQPASSPALYEDRIGDNHHHVICRTCGETADVDCAVGYRPCLKATDKKGFDIEEAEVIYWGTCPSCQIESKISNQKGA